MDQAQDVETRSKTDWSIEHHIVDSIQPLKKPKRRPPVFGKDDPVPVLSEWSCHIFILLHASWPLLAEKMYAVVMNGSELPILLRFLLYIGAFVNMMLREAKLLLKLGKRVGFLDGDQHERDRVPDDGVRKTLFTVIFFATVRPSSIVLIPYLDPQCRQGIGWWQLLVGLCIYPLIVDMWFYAYHRGCHEISFLWKYHRTHHLTKHPVPLLASYSDFGQEVIEVILVPVAAYFTMRSLLGAPLSMHEWWLCQAYILFEEIMGHCGLRAYAVAPALSSPVLRLFGCELVIEDHDLHHRRGWRQSYNYGKQTRLWDKIFGTIAPRMETDNVDWQSTVHLPSF